MSQIKQFICHSFHVSGSPVSLSNLSEDINAFRDNDIPLSATGNLADYLNRLSKWHRGLCDIIDSVSSCYDLTLFVSIAYCFVSSVLGIYSSATPSSEREVTGNYPQIIWTACFTCRIVLLSIIPSVTVSEVSNIQQ